MSTILIEKETNFRPAAYFIRLIKSKYRRLI